MKSCYNKHIHTRIAISLSERTIMAKERRDSKNRLLWKGEYQKEDGRYMYRYTDASGKVGYIYSWTLTKSDRAPKGKDHGVCLRDLEKRIQQDIQDGIKTKDADTITVNDYFELYLKQKINIKPTTRSNYRKNYNKHLRDRIGNRPLSSIKYSDVKQCYKSIIEERNISIATLSNIDATLSPILTLAVRDNLLRNNPASGVLKEIKKLASLPTESKDALTIEQQNAFLKHLDTDTIGRKWKTLFSVLLGTGMRIGEACSLTWDDCDFEKDIIHIRRSLSYYPEEHTRKCEYHLQSPKTSAGIRKIPMLSDIKAILKEERKRQLREGICGIELEGVSGFIFTCHGGGLMNSKRANAALYRIIDTYNLKETEAAKKEKRAPVILPKFSVHVLRHTFCTRMCEAGVNLRVLQEVMGHSKITMTMNVYTTVTDSYRTEAFKKVDCMVKIG